MLVEGHALVVVLGEMQHIIQSWVSVVFVIRDRTEDVIIEAMGVVATAGT